MTSGAEDDVGAFAAGLDGPAAGVAGCGDHACRRAVVGAVAGDDLGLAGVHARDLEGGFVGVGAGGGEEEFVEAFREHVEEELAEFGAGGGGVERRGVGQGRGLLLDRLDDRLIVVAEVRADELRGEIEVAFTVAVGEVAAVGAGDVDWVPAFALPPGAVVMFFGEGDDFSRGKWSGHGRSSTS